MQDIEELIHQRAWTLWEANGRKGRLEDFWNEAAATTLGEDDFRDEGAWAVAEDERAGGDRCAAGTDPEPEELDGPGATGRR